MPTPFTLTVKLLTVKLWMSIVKHARALSAGPNWLVSWSLVIGSQHSQIDTKFLYFYYECKQCIIS